MARVYSTLTPREASGCSRAKITTVRLGAKLVIAIGVLPLLWFGGLVWDYFDPGSIAHVSMQYDLKLFGSAMYEYHSATGRWPARLNDLAQTSLPQRSPRWRQGAQPIVFLWPQNLKPDPKDN